MKKIQGQGVKPQETSTNLQNRADAVVDKNTSRRAILKTKSVDKDWISKDQGSDRRRSIMKPIGKFQNK